MPLAQALDPLGVQGKTVKDSDVACLKACFETHAVEGKITLEQFDSVAKAAGTRYLERELHEYIEQQLHEQHETKYVDWFFTKSLVQKPSMLKENWKKAADMDKNLNKEVTTNVFEQMLTSLMLLADTNGEGGQIDVSMFQYVLGSCGEELEEEIFEDVMKIMGHSSKGKLDMRKFLRCYGELGKKVGHFSDEDLEQMEEVITSVKTRIDEKKKKLEALQKGEVEGAAPPSPDAAGSPPPEPQDSPRAAAPDEAAPAPAPA